MWLGAVDVCKRNEEGRDLDLSFPEDIGNKLGELDLLFVA